MFWIHLVLQINVTLLKQTKIKKTHLSGDICAKLQMANVLLRWKEKNLAFVLLPFILK